MKKIELLVFTAPEGTYSNCFRNNYLQLIKNKFKYQVEFIDLNIGRIKHFIPENILKKILGYFMTPFIVCKKNWSENDISVYSYNFMNRNKQGIPVFLCEVFDLNNFISFVNDYTQLSNQEKNYITKLLCLLKCVSINKFIPKRLFLTLILPYLIDDFVYHT